MFRPPAGLCLFTLLCVLSAGTAQGATPPSDTRDPRIASLLSELEQTRRIRQTALAPDSQWIAWVVDGAVGTEIQVAATINKHRRNGRRASRSHDGLPRTPLSGPITVCILELEV